MVPVSEFPTLVMHPGHDITVTPTPIRVYVECSCGLLEVCANRSDANRNALAHHHYVGGCNCPERVRALDVHPFAHVPEQRVPSDRS